MKVTNGDDAVFVPTGATIANGWINTGSMVQAENWHWDTVHSNLNSNRDVQSMMKMLLKSWE